MFGLKARRIEELKKRVEELEKANLELRTDAIKYRANIEKLDEELEKIKPVVATSGFKPAVTDKCDSCKFAYYSDYDDELMGCCKGMVCDDFEPYREKE